MSKNIVIVTLSYPDELGNQQGIFIHNQAKALAKHGFNISVFFVDLRSIRRKRKFGFSKYNIDGILVFRYAFPIGPFPTFVNFVAPMLMKRLYLTYLKDYGKPDLLHAHFWNAGNCALSIYNAYKIPYVITEHGTDILMGNYSWKNINFIKKIYNNSVFVISVSSALQRRIGSLVNCNIDILPNVIQDYWFKNTEKASSINKNGFVFVSTGNLIKRKRFDLTIKAFGEVSKEFQNINLIIIGKGGLCEELQKLVQELGLNSKVSFLGDIKNGELPSIYKNADCFVLPSDFETFGVVFIEAMACGLPVIATKCGGPEDIVNNSNGLLVEKDSYKELAKAMKIIINEENKYDKDKIRNNVYSKYSENAFITAITKIYNQVK